MRSTCCFRAAFRPAAGAATWCALLAVAGTLAAAPVNDARLRDTAAEPANWLTYGQGYHNRRYSTLDEIHRGNVDRLVPKWIYQTGIEATFETSPLVDDGVMYFSTPYNQVIAVDAATGEHLWRYRHHLQAARDELCCGPANRGLAMGYGRLYMITVDARLIALDRADGEVVWDMAVADPTAGTRESLEALRQGDPLRDTDVTGWTSFGGNMPPLVYDGMVIVGVSGAGYGLHLEGRGAGEQPLHAVVGLSGKQYGLRAFVSAYDADTGNLVWRWYVTPETGWQGQFRTETPSGDELPRDIAAEKAHMAEFGDAWKRGGGSVWTHPALDPERGLLYVGTGNPAPQMDGDTRPGDNLHTVSLVALDVQTGELRWAHQQVPHDLWGYDTASPPVLMELETDGGTVPAVTQAGKTGWLYVHDRRTGELLRRSEPFVPHRNTFSRPTRGGVTIAPGAAGGASWSPTAYHPGLGWVYIAGLHLPTRYTVHERDGGDPGARPTYTSLSTVEGLETYGTLTAIDPATGDLEWQTRTDAPLVGGVTATAGGLVFMGEGTGSFGAWDATTGEKLWQFNTGAGVNAPPVVYEVNGKEYVAVAAGGHQLFGYRLGQTVIAFGLPEK